MDDQMPSVLAGRYELLEVAGRGGMATVYRGRDRELGRVVAVKVLDPRLSGDQAFRARFRREARAAAGLNHPNVVAVYDTGSDGGREFIVMEFVRGRTLAEVLDAQGPLDVRDALSIAADVAAALQAAHDVGLVHRDVSPRNILLAGDGAVKVTDFGIARAVDEETLGHGDVLGTASYLAPEQAQGAATDGRTDLYSLGCVLFAMLAGRPPFTLEPVSVRVAQHLREVPAAPSSLRTEVPPAVDAIVLKALEKDPADRFGSADEMRSALLEGGARPAGRVAQLAREAGVSRADESAPAGLSAAGATAGMAAASAAAQTGVTQAAEAPVVAGDATAGTRLVRRESGSPQAGASGAGVGEEPRPYSTGRSPSVPPSSPTGAGTRSGGMSGWRRVALLAVLAVALAVVVSLFAFGFPRGGANGQRQPQVLAPSSSSASPSPGQRGTPTPPGQAKKQGNAHGNNGNGAGSGAGGAGSGAGGAGSGSGSPTTTPSPSPSPSMSPSASPTPVPLPS